MSSTPTSSPPGATPLSAPPPSPTHSPEEVEIKIISHSNLFYWWPVWAVGLVMAMLTFFDGHRMAIVPDGTVAEKSRTVQGHEDQGAHDVLIVPKGKSLPLEADNSLAQPRLHVALSKSYGVLFAITLLLVIVITNVPLRGLWSVVAIVVIVLMSIIFSLADLWEPIFRYFTALHIHINAGGYLFTSLVLLGLWLVTFFFFDQQTFMIFTPGQLKVRTEIGGGEKAYDTSGMTIEKRRSDLFRHWVLGLGLGDLIVNTSGAAVHHFYLPNVLFVGRKVQLIEDMLREKAVVRGR